MSKWLTLHPKVKALAVAAAVVVLGSVGGLVSGDVSLHDALVANVPLLVGLLVAYLKSA